jgi:hypothetical protein
MTFLQFSTDDNRVMRSERVFFELRAGCRQTVSDQPAYLLLLRRSSTRSLNSSPSLRLKPHPDNLVYPREVQLQAANLMSIDCAKERPLFRSLRLSCALSYIEPAEKMLSRFVRQRIMSALRENMATDFTLKSAFLSHLS